jgi:DNA-binding XRE family transcriptional regulator
MSAFDQLADRVRAQLGGRDDLSVSVEEPARPDGLYFLTINRTDGFVVEVEWQRHRGFGIVAGRDLAFGSGVDEVYGSAEGAVERIGGLVETGEATSSDQAVDLIDLRKLRGLLQKDVADRLGISKSGIAQMERPEALNSMQIDTLRRIVASLGGELVLTARFPQGSERQIAID